MRSDGGLFIGKLPKDATLPQACNRVLLIRCHENFYHRLRLYDIIACNDMMITMKKTPSQLCFNSCDYGGEEETIHNSHISVFLGTGDKPLAFVKMMIEAVSLA